MHELNDLMIDTANKNGKHTSKTSSGIVKIKPEETILLIKKQIAEQDLKKVSIVVDEDNRKITIDNNEYSYHRSFSYRDLRNIPSVQKNMHKVCYSNANRQHQNKIVRNVVLNYTLNGNPRNFLKLINGLFYKVFVAPYPPEVVNLLLIRNGTISSNYVNYLSSKHATEAVMEVYWDNLFHLMPIVFAFAKSPQVLKQELGSSTWKSIANNTVGRNKVLASYILNSGRVIDLGSKIADSIEIAKRASLLPTTLLKHIGIEIAHLEYAARHSKGKWKNKQEVVAQSRYYVDTVGMLNQLSNYEPKYKDLTKDCIKWSVRRLREEHNNFAKKLTELKTDGTPYRWLESVPVKYFTFKGFTAELLVSERDIATEGRIMGHCVASYARSVADGGYLVFSIKDPDGLNYSTLGILRISQFRAFFEESDDITTNKPKWTIHQHYKRFNKPVDNPIAEELANLLVKELSGEI